MSKKQKTLCVVMRGPDEQMDQVGDGWDSSNPLPKKCGHCTFPDLDFIPEPYLLAKGFAAPGETSIAFMGNFLVRDRVRKILETVVPGACTFHPTAERKTKKPTDWWLAVPKQKLEVLVPKPTKPFCSKCGEAKGWGRHQGEVWEKMNKFDSGGVDVFKTADWSGQGTAEDDFASTNKYRTEQSKIPPLKWSQAYRGIEPPTHPERWTRQRIDRELYFSLRLEELFNRAGIKGKLRRLVYFKSRPSKEDEAWVEEKLALLSKSGLIEAPNVASSAKTSPAMQKWFAGFLARNKKKGIKASEFNAVEKKQKLKLPPGYKAFMAAIGPKSFDNVNGTEGFTANVVAPTKMDFKDYRSGRVPHLSEAESKIDGVMFATTDHGDCFVFDVAVGGGDYPVYWYNHEENTLEPFAPNFPECIKRFAQSN